MSSASPDDDRTILQPRSGGDTHADAPTLVLGAAGTAPAARAAPRAAAAAVPAAPPKPGHVTAGDIGNALPSGTRLGEFELTRVLGEGGFGIVYTAQDHSLQRRVALKEYMPSTLAGRTGDSRVQVRSERCRETFEAGLKSFVNEARLLAQFDHPSLVKVYRFWEANGTAYMVMPLYEGTTLKDKLKRLVGQPDEAWLMGMLAPLTDALAVIHAENCYHRDIAPDNIILLAGHERPLLLDFGAARRVISDMTQALTVILKPGYAPLEQYAEVPEMKQGPWTDVYALAATVHYAITGRTPPPSVGRLMNDTHKPLQQTAAGRYSPGFLAALDRALAVRPADRTPSIEALRADLGLPSVASSQVQPQATVILPSPRSTPYVPSVPSAPAVPLPPPASPEVDGTVLLQRTAAPAARPAEAAVIDLLLDTSAAAAPSADPAAARPQRLLWIGIATALLVLSVAGWLLARRAAPASPQLVAVPQPAAAPATVPVGTPVAATPPRSFEIRDEFNKVLAGQVADFKVQATPVQSSLRIGRDKLAFNVQSSRDGYVQVLVLGPDGSLLLLFPNAQSSDNRIKAGQNLRLPQADWPLDTVEPAGREEFLVVVSAQPRDYSVLSKERDYIFLKLPTGQQGAALATGWTRSTPLLLGGPKGCPGADCDAYGAAAFGVAIEH
jgi:serine/threonine protein kinase